MADNKCRDVFRGRGAELMDGMARGLATAHAMPVLCVGRQHGTGKAVLVSSPAVLSRGEMVELLAELLAELRAAP